MKHLKILWIIAMTLLILMLVQTFLRDRAFQALRVTPVITALSLTPPGYVLGHPEIQCPAVPLSYAPDVPEFTIGKELISR
jgi:lysylphosphatidylglycerol synthetase-like protein (DUF2156 family)